MEYYVHGGRGLVCPLVKPIPQAKEDEEEESGDCHVTLYNICFPPCKHVHVHVN